MFSGNFLHLGGDEANANCWDYKPSIKEYMQAHNISNYSELQADYRTFQRNVIEKNSLDKKAIFWFDENSADIVTDSESIL